MGWGWSVALALAAGLTAGAGCRPHRRPPADRLVIGTLFEPKTLDPAFARRAGDQEVVRLLFRDLTDFDADWKLQPDLAEALPTARSSTLGEGWVVDWSLRPGQRWSDGRPITAHDVVFGHRVEADARWAAVNHEDAQLVARLFALDDRKVRVYWRQPFVSYRAPRVHTVLPAHVYPSSPSAGEAFVGMSEAPVSSGPFRLRRWTRGVQIELERNPHWAGEPPALDTVIFRFLRSEDALETELLAGTVDAVGEAGGLSPGRARKLAARLPRHDVVLTESAIRLGIECRQDHPLVGRADVRRAMSAVVPRDRFAEVAYGGAAQPAFGLFPPRHPAYRAGRTMSATAAAAILQRFASAPPVPLQYAAESPAARRAAVFLQGVWSRAGFPVALDGKPFAVLLDAMARRQHGPLVLLALRMRPDWDGHSVLQRAGAQNYGGYFDAEVERWLAEARATPDIDAWRARLRRVEARYQRDLPSIPLLYRQSASVRPKALRGWRPTGTTTPVTWNAEQWRWSQSPP